MKEKRLHVSIVTPSKEFYEGDVEYLQIPMHDGFIGVLPDHAPLMGILGFGLLTLRDEAGVDHFIIDGGFLEINKNRVTVLANSSDIPQNITPEVAQNALDEAMNMQGVGEVARIRKEESLAAARTRLKCIRESSS